MAFKQRMAGIPYMDKDTVKLYTGQEIHGFMFPDYKADEPRWIDSKDGEMERLHAEIERLRRILREI